MNGWMGKILQVDLTAGKITEISTQPYIKDYLGGRGIASRLYREKVTPETDAFDHDNRLIFMTGPLVATGTQGATRMSVVGKSPMTLPEGFCYGNIGGFFGPELKKAGYDGIIVDGCAEKPVYLWIDDNRVELRDAASLWGQGAYRTGETLAAEHGDKVRFVTTGVAGENKVRTATLIASHESTASAGFGAVLGAKKLKAIAVRGSGKPQVADAEKLKELNRYTTQIYNRLKLIPPALSATGRGQAIEIIGRGNCYQCGLECSKRQYRYGPNLEGHRRCQSVQYYLPWKYAGQDEPIETFFEAPALANDYSIDTWELESMMDWLYTCHKEGVLTEADTGLPLQKIGTREFLDKLLHSIAYREGFGDLLAEGLVRAGEHLPAAARNNFSYMMTPVGTADLFPSRALLTTALLYSLEPRVHHNMLHEVGYTYVAWRINQDTPDRSPVTTKVFHDVAKAFWGSDAAGDMSSYEGKALAVKIIQDRTLNKESLGLCDFAWPATYSFNTPDNVGDPGLEARIFSSVTGIPGEELERYAGNLCNLQREILVGEGRRVPEDDYPAEYNFEVPLKEIPNFGPAMVPGPGEETADMTGNTLDKGRFAAILQEYYQLRGWEE
ncbi:aldehyde ferredoxin oxidoreductase N-terminal domain-containing protein [Chloroflexota bacterium]